MTARLTTLLIWAAVLAGAVAWGLPLFTRSTPVPGGASLAAPAPPVGAGLARLLGQAPPAPVQQAPVVVADNRFQLLGVVAPRRGSSSGLALIAVDGKPARALAVGREIEPGLRVLTVGHRQVELGAAAGAPSVTLTLPPLAEAQRGRPGDLPGQPLVAMPGMVPGAAYPGAPGAMRVPPLPTPQQQLQMQMQMQQQQLQQQQQMQMQRAVPVPQSEPVPANLPYQPDANGTVVEQGGNPPGAVPSR